MQVTNNIPQNSNTTQQPAQDLTALRGELNRLKRAKKAFPRNATHYNNLIAQVQTQMADAYAALVGVQS